jgi:hypothetical protein
VELKNIFEKRNNERPKLGAFDERLVVRAPFAID